MGKRLVLRHDVTIEDNHAWCTNGLHKHWDYVGSDPVSNAHLHIANALRQVECLCEPGKLGTANRHCPMHRSADD